MWLFSNKLFWGPLYVYFLWKLYRAFPARYYFVLVAAFLLILISDQLCNLFKESFMRLRPTHEPHLEGMIHTLKNYTGGMYGFYSGHAANAFAVAVFLLTALKWKPNYLILIAFSFASLTAYSRIYLGVHYPGDVLFGAFMGSILGYGISKLLIFVYAHWGNPERS